MTVSRIWSRVLSPHYPDVLVGADLRVRPEEGNHAGLPLHRNCPGPMRRHPLQSLYENLVWHLGRFKTISV